MFLGEYNYKLDEKAGCLSRQNSAGIEDGIILVPGPEKCIIAYTPEEWKKISENMRTGSLAKDKMRRLNRALFSTAFHLNLDGQGRIALPAPLRNICRNW